MRIRTVLLALVITVVPPPTPVAWAIAYYRDTGRHLRRRQSVPDRHSQANHAGPTAVITRLQTRRRASPFSGVPTPPRQQQAGRRRETSSPADRPLIIATDEAKPLTAAVQKGTTVASRSSCSTQGGG